MKLRGDNDGKGVLKAINEQVEKISAELEKSKIEEYVNYLKNPKKMLLTNFIAGLARGFGAGIGFTILSAIIIYLLQAIVMWKLPVIGEFISDIVDIVRNNLDNR